MSLLASVTHIGVIHISFHFADWFAAEKIGMPREDVNVNPYARENLRRCSGCVKCSFSQTKCQSTLYHMHKADMQKSLCSAQSQVKSCISYYQEVEALSPALMRHRLHHGASRRRCNIFWMFPYILDALTYSSSRDKSPLMSLFESSSQADTALVIYFTRLSL